MKRREEQRPTPALEWACRCPFWGVLGVFAGVLAFPYPK